jgi:hypothetical protein
VEEVHLLEVHLLEVHLLEAVQLQPRPVQAHTLPQKHHLDVASVMNPVLHHNHILHTAYKYSAPHPVAVAWTPKAVVPRTVRPDQHSH